jgi:hypothetical protein
MCMDIVIEINLVNERFVARPHGLMQSRRLTQYRVRVTFRLTVSQSIRLGVKPILGLLTSQSVTKVNNITK